MAFACHAGGRGLEPRSHRSYLFLPGARDYLLSLKTAKNKDASCILVFASLKTGIFEDGKSPDVLEGHFDGISNCLAGDVGGE